MRLAGGEVLATFQYAEGASPGAHDHGGTAPSQPQPGTMSAQPANAGGGLVLMSENGEVIRSASALDSNVTPQLAVNQRFRDGGQSAPGVTRPASNGRMDSPERRRPTARCFRADDTRIGGKR